MYSINNRAYPVVKSAGISYPDVFWYSYYKAWQALPLLKKGCPTLFKK
jgi:hypothetical protein